MELKQKKELIKVVHRAMDDFIEENKSLYGLLEQQEQAMVVTMFVSGFLTNWIQTHE